MTTTDPSTYVPARALTPFGQFELHPTHLKTPRVAVHDFPQCACAKDHPGCRRCDKPIRPRGTKRAEHPGTISAGPGGYCYRCAELRPAPAAPASTADTTPRRTPATAVRGEWQTRGVCAEKDRDPDLWFTDAAWAVKEAVRLCQACPVLAQCRTYALTMEASQSGWSRWGVYAAMTPRERAAAPTPSGVSA